MRAINLPTDLLRAFVSVIDLGGYTRAADALGRTQPAISLQMKRLEELLDAKLLTHEGRELKLTEEGEALAVYARQLLGLNDEAVAKLKGRAAKGQLRVGLPTDFSVAFLQDSIVDFAGEQAKVTLSITCDLSRKLLDLLHADEQFDLTLCNPPFHVSAEEAASGSRRKWKNLGKLDPQRKLPELNFGGQNHELWCTGGEASFVKRMIRESQIFASQVLWFSTLVSKSGNLPDIYKQLNKLGACEVRTIEMAQGNKQSRFVAWTFNDAEQRRQWVQARWTK